MAIWVLVSGLDDLFIAVVYLATRRRRVPAPEPEDPTLPPARIAVLLPCWREHAVVAEMLEHNLSVIAYPSYDFFVGVYPNDPLTVRAAREVSDRSSRVHVILCPHPGPTSKADCLNWIYKGLEEYERVHGARFGIIVTHDAEDLIHPQALALIGLHARRFDMVQVPVLPLATPAGEFTHGVYCDEFAEYQIKDIPARQALGGFLPSNGVGTGFTREVLERLAARHGGRIFDPGCLTEDYENGLRIHALGGRQVFLPLGVPAVATREYFPRRPRAAIRQRSRWVTGISLQCWERHGWDAGPGQLYWLWRDRKGLVGNLLTPAANLLTAYGAATWLAAVASHQSWALGALTPPALRPVFPVLLALSVSQLLMRTVCAARIYGWRFAWAAPVRAVWANAINAAATAAALYHYAQARWRRRPLAWRKTEHIYPAGLVSGPLRHIPTGAPETVSRAAARALSARLCRRWRVLPFQVAAGRLYVAAPAPPSDALLDDLRRASGLSLRFQLVPEPELEPLLAAHLPRRC
jgi:adsorption protein B